MNKDGKGGFKDHPENINKEGPPGKGNTYADITEEVMGEMVLNPNDKNQRISRKEKAIRFAAGKAENGDLSALKELKEWTDGKSQNNVDLTTKGEKIDNPIVKALEEGE